MYATWLFFLYGDEFPVAVHLHICTICTTAGAIWFRDRWWTVGYIQTLGCFILHISNTNKTAGQAGHLALSVCIRSIIHWNALLELWSQLAANLAVALTDFPVMASLADTPISARPNASLTSMLLLRCGNPCMMGMSRTRSATLRMTLLSSLRSTNCSPATSLPNSSNEQRVWVEYIGTKLYSTSCKKQCDHVRTHQPAADDQSVLIVADTCSLREETAFHSFKQPRNWSKRYQGICTRKPQVWWANLPVVEFGMFIPTWDSPLVMKGVVIIDRSVSEGQASHHLTHLILSVCTVTVHSWQKVQVCCSDAMQSAGIS